ncbi:MAG TPA: hypothetical protein VIE65_04110 [Methylobacter sp.]|jgi:hypothetical protein
MARQALPSISFRAAKYPSIPKTNRQASYFKKLARVVSVDDLKTFFAGKQWKGVFKDGGFDGRYPGDILTYLVNIKPSGITFYYKIWAKEDPSDSEEGVTDAPIKSLAEFVGQGIPGGEVFERMSSDPNVIIKEIRSLPIKQSNKKKFRRFSAALISAQARKAYSWELEADEINKLLQSMKSKGWRASPTKINDNPAIRVDIGEEFEAEIEVSDIMYSFEFEIEGQPSLTKKGTTDDPIREFQNYYRSPEIESIYEEAKSSRDLERNKGTVPSGPRR